MDNLTAVRNFFRQSLEERYDPDTLARLPEFRGLNPTVLEDLRQFVLQRLYPPPAERDALDHAFQVVMGMTANPAKTGRAALALSKILLFRGRYLPFLVQVAGLLITSYEALRTIETETARMLESSSGKPGEANRSSDRFTMARAAGRVDRTFFDRFIDGVSAIVASFSNLRGWEVALEVAAALEQAFQREPSIWSPDERKAATLARELLEDCVHLIRQLSPEQIQSAAHGIRKVETRWVEELSGSARGEAEGG